MKRRNNDKSAIALHYDEKNAPRISAKGSGELAEQIIALAKEHDVPLHEDGELAALLSQLELGEEIPRELYLAVAEVLAFAYMLTGKLPGEKPE
ncbi:MAG: EscU/YscU/HrcU family type III secretion system export apparatus switch protein [Pseudomonadota bacterium]